MAVREISTRLTLTGENSFNNALKAMNRNMQLLDAEMKKASITFGDADQRESLLTKQSEILNDKLKQQQNIIATLEKELEQAAKAYGDTDQRVDRLRVSIAKAQTEEAKINREIKKTNKELSEYQDKLSEIDDGNQVDISNAFAKAQTEIKEINRELEETGRELREIQGPLRRAGAAIEDNLTDQAREARDELDDMLEGMQDDLNSIKFNTGFSAFRDFGEGIADIWSGLDGFVAGTRDYRRQMAYLAQNAEAAGEDFARVKQMAMEVAALTGDMDGAVEGLSNLLAAGYKGEGLKTISDYLASMAILMPETIKFENVAESLLETLSTGATTGQFQEFVDKKLGSHEELDKALEKRKSLLGRMQDIEAYLKITNLDTYYKDFAEKNAALLEEAMADQKWQDALAGIGENISEKITPLKSLMADVIYAWKATLDGEDGSWEQLSLSTGKITELLNNWAKELVNAASDGFTGFIDDWINSLGTVFGSIGEGIRNAFGVGNQEPAAVPYSEPIGPELPESMKQTMEGAGETAGTAAGQSLADAIAAKQGEVEAAVQSITDAVNRIIDKVKPIEIKVKDNTGTSGTGQAFGGGNSGDPLEFNFNVDGVSLGRVMAPYVSREMGKAASLRVRTGRG